MIQEISDWFVGDDSAGTALANLVTIGGVFGGLAILGKISASLSLSGDISVRLLHASLKTADDSSATLNENWPPGDRSRILYSVYSVSRKWDEPYWSGNFAHNDARVATAAQRAAGSVRTPRRGKYRAFRRCTGARSGRRRAGEVGTRDRTAPRRASSIPAPLALAGLGVSLLQGDAPPA